MNCRGAWLTMKRTRSLKNKKLIFSKEELFASMTTTTKCTTSISSLIKQARLIPHFTKIQNHVCSQLTLAHSLSKIRSMTYQTSGHLLTNRNKFHWLASCWSIRSVNLTSTASWMSRQSKRKKRRQLKPCSRKERSSSNYLKKSSCWKKKWKSKEKMERARKRTRTSSMTKMLRKKKTK